MFSKWFKRDSDEKSTITTGPEIIGLRNGASFEVDGLMLRLAQDSLVTEGITPTQIITAAGKAAMDDVQLIRFYTDDDAFLQVVVQGPLKDENVIDVKLFHYYDTVDVSSQRDWNTLLSEKMGNPEYTLEGHVFSRVWQSTSDYHPPVPMTETTYDSEGNTSQTDQFTMLYEREYEPDEYESVFLSAEESFDDHGNVNRCFVISTGISLTPSQITIHG